MTSFDSQLLVSDIVLHLPEILEGEQKNALTKSVESLSKGENIDFSNYFETRQVLPPNELSQGDVYEGLPYLTLPIKTLPLTTVPLRPGMIVSNSCSTSPDSKGAMAGRVLYAPVISLKKLEELITEQSPNSIQLVEDIRKQKPMNYFYLPAVGNRHPESVVLFDNMLSVNMNIFATDDLGEKVRYRLTLESWYHLLIKLSAYFTRVTSDLVTERSQSSTL